MLATVVLLTAFGAGPRGHAAAASSVTFDVVVYGGTPAGVVAAVTAWRAGASVILLEPSKHLGGMVSSGLGGTDYGDRWTIGGYAREFFTRTRAIEGNPDGEWHFSPSAAELAFRQMVWTTQVKVYYGQRLLEGSGVVRSGSDITSLRMTSGLAVRGTTFIDATYEGDLMAQAGVSYRVGRESKAQYGESLAGVRPTSLVLQQPVAPAEVPDINPLHLAAAPAPVGSGDARIQDSNYRICFSSRQDTQVPFSPPAGYDPDAYGQVAAYIAARGITNLSSLLNLGPLVGNKFDVNSAGSMSMSLPGKNWAYPTGTYAQRAAIEAAHRSYAQGFIYFLTSDARVPATIRSQLSAYGLCRDEFTDNQNWPRLLYLREGRRMVGWYVLTQADIVDHATKTSIIGIASYRVDAHAVSRWGDGFGDLFTEGSLSLPKRQWAIPYRAITPRPTEVTNLLVPVTASASHVAYASLRMEPQYMIMGEAAGEAAALTVQYDINVHQVNTTWLQNRLKSHGAYLINPS